MSEKVFCIDCLYYEEGSRISNEYGPPDHYFEKCQAPQNFRDDYQMENREKVSTPQIINRFNNCPWFVSRDSQVCPTDSSSSSVSGDSDVDMDYDAEDVELEEDSSSSSSSSSSSRN